MARSLGALALPDGDQQGSIDWVDRYEPASVAQSAVRTLGGSPVVFSQALTRGRPITLEAVERVCWLTQAMVDTLLGMAAQPGASFAFLWDAEAHSVVFRHHEPPALEVTPIYPHADQYTGRIKLMTV